MTRRLAAAASGLLLLLARQALASPTSTSTEYVVVTTTTSLDYAYDSTETVTTTRTVRSYITPSASPTATSTYTNTFWDVEVVALYVPPDAVSEYEFAPDALDGLVPGGAGGATSTVYIAPVTYAAPASCPTPFTVTTTAEVSVRPTQTADLRPTYSRTVTGFWGPAVTLYLSAAPPGPAPTTGYDYENYIAECQPPPSWSSSSSSGSSSGIGLDDEICLRHSLCMTWGHWIIVLASVLPGLFLLGFVESFFWFGRLMRGRGAMRFGTCCWILLSGWVVCATRTSPARAPEDWPALEARWKAMPAGEKWRLWWKWGFRHKYPVDLLGPDPKRAARAPGAKVEEGDGSVVAEARGPAPEQGQGHKEHVQVQQVQMPPSAR